MYPWELDQFIKSQNHKLNKHEMWDRYVNYYWFNSIEVEKLTRKRI